MALTNLTQAEATKIKAILDAGETVLEEIDTLKEGLSDTVKALAEEIDVKPSTLNRAIRLSYKSRTDNAIEAAQEEMSDVEIILHAGGKM